MSTTAGTLIRTVRVRRRRGPLLLVVLLAVTLVLPIPWRHVISDDPPGTAWRLNGRLEVNGDTIDPGGRWSWLAVGRPQLVGEWLYEMTLPRQDYLLAATDLRDGPVSSSPALTEPAAAAVGLRHAGVEVALGLLVEVREPVLPGLPETAVIVAVDGQGVTDRAAWERLSVAPRTLQTVDGDTIELAEGTDGLPYERVHLLDTADGTVTASIGFGVPDLPVLAAIRNMSLGSSHGMMVALTTYAEHAGHDLAQGRHIAGTGGVQGDGTVTAIGGLPAKARAARRAGADVLLFPATQADELDGFAAGTMRLIGVDTLTDAIDELSGGRRQQGNTTRATQDAAVR